MRFFRNCKKYFPFSIYYTKCQLHSEVARMRLGWLWWFLEPFLFTLVYLFIFSFVFQKKMLFALSFISIGRALWTFFSKTCNNSVIAVRHYHGLLLWLNIPKYVLLFNAMLVNGFKMLISLVLCVMLMLWEHVPPAYTMFLFVPIAAVFLLFTFGVSLWLLHVGVYFPDMKQIVSVLFRVLFYFSGIFYSLEDRMNEITARVILRYNPVGFLLAESRNVLLYQRLPDWHMLGIWLAVSAALVLSGLIVTRIYEKDYVKVV